MASPQNYNYIDNTEILCASYDDVGLLRLPISLPGITFTVVNVPSPSSTMYFCMCFDNPLL